MKRSILALLTATALIATINSCYYDTASLLYPSGSGACDTTNVTYSATINNILLNNSCLTCHGGTGAAGGNIVLDTYAGLNSYAANGRLIGSISQASGFIAMPQGGNKLSDCDIRKVKAWITAGMKNN